MQGRCCARDHRDAEARRPSRLRAAHRAVCSLRRGHDPASGTISAAAAQRRRESSCTSHRRRRRGSAAERGSSSKRRRPMSTYASSWPVTMRVMLNVADPRSKYPPRIDDPSISVSSAIDTGSTGRPRKPGGPEQRAEIGVVGRARSEPANRRRVRARVPPPLVAKKRSPLLISCTTPNATSPERRVERDGGMTAIDTQQDSRPAAAGRVPSIGSTTKIAVARRTRRSRGLRSSTRCHPPTRDTCSTHVLGDLVDRHGDVTTRRDTDSRACFGWPSDGATAARTAPTVFECERSEDCRHGRGPRRVALSYSSTYRCASRRHRELGGAEADRRPPAGPGARRRRARRRSAARRASTSPGGTKTASRRAGRRSRSPRSPTPRSVFRPPWLRGGPRRTTLH